MVIDDCVRGLPSISKRGLKEASERYRQLKVQLKPVIVYSEEAEVLRERAESVEALRITQGIDGEPPFIRRGSVRYDSRYEA